MRELIAYALLALLFVWLTGGLLVWRRNLPKHKYRRERRLQREAHERHAALADRSN